jgi:cobalt-zinc-cadmium efflux system outer membrane protein
MRAVDHRTRSFKKPSVARFLVTATLTLGFANAAGAQEANAPASLTEQAVVTLALQRAPLIDVVEGEVAIEEGRGQTAGARRNPQLSYIREQTFGDLGSTESYLSVAQPIDLGSRRGLHRKAGAERSRAARQEGEALRVSIAADARLRFYEALYRKARAQALEAWVARIDEALAIVTRRAQRGDAAAYDRKRLERERAVATSRLESERAALERGNARLQSLLGTGANTTTVRVTGTLLPESDPAALPALRESSKRRPDLLALNRRIEAATIDRTAAARWWVPDLQLEGGWKSVDLGREGRTDGYLVGASLSLPFWNESSGLARVAEGEAGAARGRRALLESEIDGELGGAHAEAVRLRRAAAEFRERTTTVSRELERIASAGYEGGELGLLELLDAYRGAAEDALTALELEHAARRGRIELDRLTGTGVP